VVRQKNRCAQSGGKKFGAGNTTKAERKMTDEELTLKGLKSVGEIKLLGTKPF